MKIRSLFLFMIIIALVAMFSFAGGCRDDGTGGEAAAGQEVAGEESQASQGEEGEKTEDAAEETGSSGDKEDETGQEEENMQEMEIPEEITSKVEEAESLFADGLYAEASKEYRNAQIAIEGSDLPEEIKDGLLQSIDENYNTAKNTAEAARTHHSNAMNLIYEKRYEEAEAELRAALDIYPKYQVAIDALESLEDIKGLQ